tara:strand:- start:26622 stop:26852 length:231 start_codon:yes stop_codon:yes gene_type:complete
MIVLAIAQLALSSGEGDDNDARQFSIGYDYAAGKNTPLYLAYAKPVMIAMLISVLTVKVTVIKLFLNLAMTQVSYC